MQGAAVETKRQMFPSIQDKATLLQELLKSHQFGAIFSSPMKRAVETAFLATNQTPKISLDLREWKLGYFEETPVELFLKHIRDLFPHILLPKRKSRIRSISPALLQTY